MVDESSTYFYYTMWSEILMTRPDLLPHIYLYQEPDVSKMTMEDIYLFCKEVNMTIMHMPFPERKYGPVEVHFLEKDEMIKEWRLAYKKFKPDSRQTLFKSFAAITPCFKNIRIGVHPSILFPIEYMFNHPYFMDDSTPQFENLYTYGLAYLALNRAYNGLTVHGIDVKLIHKRKVTDKEGLKKLSWGIETTKFGHYVRLEEKEEWYDIVLLRRSMQNVTLQDSDVGTFPERQKIKREIEKFITIRASKAYYFLVGGHRMTASLNDVIKVLHENGLLGARCHKKEYKEYIGENCFENKELDLLFKKRKEELLNEYK